MVSSFKKKLQKHTFKFSICIDILQKQNIKLQYKTRQTIHNSLVHRVTHCLHVHKCHIIAIFVQTKKTKNINNSKTDREHGIVFVHHNFTSNSESIV